MIALQGMAELIYGALAALVLTFGFGFIMGCIWWNQRAQVKREKPTIQPERVK